MRYQAALLAENEAHLTACPLTRQYLFKDKCLIDENTTMTPVMASLYELKIITTNNKNRQLFQAHTLIALLPRLYCHDFVATT
ncbi:hypothetical protein [Xenorhabdus szentirmaii]|uniref:Uncharacterized protein n=1 Tax=Xenorhabdus szentirmaii DSM 16338 TaxID=1427518 RepID=W1J2Z2_9GAMM|nr:hypothetical protein [Xenorhabdus szentirmaii]CDL85089.1 hypothetical protein XSR1_60133 [Xenorhabdus szentirmaii DSM 16338]